MSNVSRGLFVVGAFFLGIAPLAGREVEEVRLDTSSGTIAERLPFDVPFTILGTAPPGTTRVTLQYEETTSGNGMGSPLAPLTPLVSGVNADGVFRIQMPALDANRFFVFRLSFERHLSREGASAFRRDVVALVDSELQAGLVELDTERLAESILRALERAVNDGVAIRPAQGTVIFEGLDAPSIRASLLTLVEPLLRLRLERGRDVARYLTTSLDLEEAIGRVVESPALRDLLRELENRPELDPRNPRNLLHLREESSELLGLNEVEVEALSRGETPGQTSKPLAEVFVAADADTYRARYLASERALGELREWLLSLVTAGAPNRSTVDELLQSGVLTEDGLDALAALAQPRIGAIHRAQRWAEALEGYVYAVSTSLAARSRELHRLSLALESMYRETFSSTRQKTRRPDEIRRTSLRRRETLILRPIGERKHSVPARPLLRSTRVFLDFALALEKCLPVRDPVLGCLVFQEMAEPAQNASMVVHLVFPLPRPMILAAVQEHYEILSRPPGIVVQLHALMKIDGAVLVAEEHQHRCREVSYEHHR